ncbi:MAG: Glycosyl transferase family 2 [Candidatus Uhrbacteria bacterium GW2011_GWE2_45_35]|uniref:Glycosyl transferase family 2 n=2 Tax=Candidatus Uhriibacteriota TaxID=1752732 RepID=A0A0G1JJJ3_9BACT|nr:MAG: Glycosyl transferase family 2 [Candidatus Uhrbacteria bacterium GW2011_GWF2_44_350]KKU08730.1 MAG: Glycosyl transferase family 2 [Candidatus Uhrbacteria bacterium GW2011_GWE2_45_35]HBR80763.1 glycosyl transferase family 2 [Candidatus Uhrbacteria bacterium]HCU31875.1 glycosyl transferase family 2 [Candidatus Uhrbacteria bacterium]
MISIIIITKNEEDYLPILLRSIKKQTVQPLEVIVADADSTDRTREIAKQFGCRVVKGGMPSVGRNAGAKVAKGDTILFLDADVKLTDKHFLERAEHEMTARKFDFASCDVIPLSNHFFDRLAHGFYNFYSRLVLPFKAHAPGFCIFAKKSKHEILKGFDEAIPFCEDHDYAVRCRKIGKFGYLNSTHPEVSVRRLDRDGRLNILVKYFLGELHLMFLGPVRHNRFNYSFGYKKKEEELSD